MALEVGVAALSSGSLLGSLGRVGPGAMALEVGIWGSPSPPPRQLLGAVFQLHFVFGTPWFSDKARFVPCTFSPL